MNELKNTYESMRLRFLCHINMLGCDTEYEYKNASEVEFPAYITFQEIRIGIRNTKMFETMCMGTLENLKELESGETQTYENNLTEIYNLIKSEIQQKEIILENEIKLAA